MKHLNPIGILCALCVSAGSASADPVQLKFGFPSPPTSWTNTLGATPWIKQVEGDAPGTVEIKLFPGGSIATFRTVYDRLLNGVVDIAFGTFGEIGDQYPRTSVWSLPFEAPRASIAGLAVWRLYESGVISEEYGKVKPLAVLGFGTAGIHTNQPIAKVEDMQGLKIVAMSRVSGDGVSLSGGAPVTMTPAELYSSLQRGLAAGVAFTWPGVDTFKIGEVTKYHVDVPFGMSGGYYFMNKDSYAKLPIEVRAAVDKHSGRAFAHMMSKAVETVDDESLARVMAMPNQTHVKLDPAAQARWKARLQPMTDEWVKATPDGTKVLEAFRGEVAKIRREM
jgi:TRAP-type C4-dicarboxylate transport system substrate-binding protein